jgi:hypothetical protein
MHEVRDDITTTAGVVVVNTIAFVRAFESERADRVQLPPAGRQKDRGGVEIRQYAHGRWVRQSSIEGPHGLERIKAALDVGLWSAVYYCTA